MKSLTCVIFFLCSSLTALGQTNVKEITASEFSNRVNGQHKGLKTYYKKLDSRYFKLRMAINDSTIRNIVGDSAKEIITQELKADSEETPITNKVNKGVDFGISLGFNSVFEKLHEARISPLDNKLKITNVPATTFLISTGLSVPFSYGTKNKNSKYYRKLDEDGNPTGTAYAVPAGWCFMATINLISFNSASTGSLFNQKVDGGLGLGYRINENFQLALTAEMISHRLPREFLINDYNDKVMMDANNKPVTAISIDDNNYYVDRYLPSVSFKFFYLLAYKPLK